MRIKRVTAKLGTMRKAADWIVYPAERAMDGKTVTVIQSDTRIAAFDPATGDGMLSKARKNGAYFMHLSPFMSATPITVPADVIAAVLDARPKSGDEIGPGVYVA